MRSTASLYQFIYLFIYFYMHLSLRTAFWSSGGPRPSMTSTCKRNQLNEVVQYKTVCSWSLTLGAYARRLQYLFCLCVCVSVCLCVCFPYSGTSRNQAYKQQYQRLQRDTGMKYKKDFSLKRFVPKLWRRLLTSSSSGVVSGILVPFFRRN